MTRRIIAVVPDLFFSTRILATARTVGVPVDLVPLPRAFAAICEKPPALVLIDLHATGNPLTLIQALKADERTKGILLVGFYSHVETALRRSALEGIALPVLDADDCHGVHRADHGGQLGFVCDDTTHTHSSSADSSGMSAMAWPASSSGKRCVNAERGSASSMPASSAERRRAVSTCE